ncbi:OmpA family protein [Variovorax sp. PCZ-1]|uniref:OmpA family protein n=1 Tax=Variovorax sp. PCZ-1 TaxID=2835533 RepID=UPI001BCE13BB|nr:OmpA family protein [Variovorax sp. PCZ-1]MBS7808112.1 OmpA family protein [Variovorax sp. PCZ-1]
MNTDNDQDSRFALGLVFVLIAIVVASVLGFAVMRKGDKDSSKPAVAAAAAAPAAATPAATPGTDGASVTVENGVVKFYFASGKAELAQGGVNALADIVAAAKTGKKVGISGFVDPSGNAAQNAELAKQRAFAVRDLLTSSGVPADQIVLVRPNDIKAGATSAAEGRRVEVFMI